MNAKNRNLVTDILEELTITKKWINEFKVELNRCARFVEQPQGHYTVLKDYFEIFLNNLPKCKSWNKVAIHMMEVINDFKAMRLDISSALGETDMAVNVIDELVLIVETFEVDEKGIVSMPFSSVKMLLQSFLEI